MYTPLILFLLLSLIFSFLCSLWEAVLLSISPSYMQIKLDEGGKIGAILQDFKENIDKPLAAILSLNTIAHTVGAIGVGTQATKIWADSDPYVTGFVVPAVMTICILVLSEIIPKTLGATNWRALAPFTISSLQIIVILLAPLVWGCQLITMFFNKDKGKSVFSRSDFLAMAQIGSQEGHLDAVESSFIHNLMHFKNYKAQDIMTPRSVAITAPEDMLMTDFYNLQEDLIFSRIPLTKKDEPEYISGYVLKDEVLEELIDGDGNHPLSKLRRDIIVVEEKHNIFQLFNEFIQKREHIALVTDLYGSMAGIVTMEDVIETLLGAEIVDETDKDIDMQDLAKRKWKNRLKKQHEHKLSTVNKLKTSTDTTNNN